jgi:hypothetical protein
VLSLPGTLCCHAKYPVPALSTATAAKAPEAGLVSRVKMFAALAEAGSATATAKPNANAPKRQRSLERVFGFATDSGLNVSPFGTLWRNVDPGWVSMLVDCSALAAYESLVELEPAVMRLAFVRDDHVTHQPRDRRARDLKQSREEACGA